MAYTPYVWHDGATGGTLVDAAHLNHIEQGIAAVATGSNPFSVKDRFGAVGDGVADDTTALNAAFAAGGLVYLDAGDYKATAQLYVYGTTKTVVTGPGRIVLSATAGGIRVNNAPHILDGITLLGAGAAATNQGGILIDGDGITVTRCTISNLARFAIYSAHDNVRIIDNVTDQTSLGTITDSPSVAAIFNSGNGVRIEGNVCTNTVWGITNRGADQTNTINDGVIVFNSITMRAGFTATTCQGISSAYARHQKIAFNTIRGYTSNSIDQYGGWYTEIEGNTCIDGAADGIFVGHMGTRSVTVVGNNVKNCGGGGIRVWDSSSNVNVIGNTIDGLGSGAGAIGINATGAANTGESDLAQITIQGNTIQGRTRTTGSTTNIGIVLRHITSVVDVSGNTITEVARQGIYAENVDIATVRNNRVQDFSRAGTYPAIHTAVGCNRFLIDDDVVYGGPTGSIAVRLESGVGHRVRGTRWRSVTTGVSDTATGTVLADNTVFN